MTSDQSTAPAQPSSVVLLQRQWLGPAGWLGLAGFAASLALAYAAAAGAVVGWVTLTVGLAAGALIGLRLSRPVVVTDGAAPELRVGRARIALHLTGSAAALDSATLLRARRAAESAQGFWAAPGWCPQAVVFTVEDPTDPHAFWVVGSRRPRQLADVINRLSESISAHGTMTGGG